jgi:UDP:flavonoid glycosyltransferase YjiC (YdhE family)
MKVLLAWELGLNYGHLTRLLPVAQRLRAQGDSVLAAVRDLHAASVVFRPAGIPFLQAPHLPSGLTLGHRASGYADILLSQGWADRVALAGLVEAWVNLFQLTCPDRLILDYSPTAMLAARIARIPAVLVGNGFELPPLLDPLPPFPGFSWATANAAAKSERRAVDNANAILGSSDLRLRSLMDLFAPYVSLLATLPELDHYGPRADARYIGPLLGELNTCSVNWPEGTGPRVFVSVRNDTSHLKIILKALATIEARIVCVVHGLTTGQLSELRKPNIEVSLHPVDLPTLRDADVCLTYGSEGTIVKFLLSGVPQLIAPWHVEAFMAARRLRLVGIGNLLEGSPTESTVSEAILRIATNPAVRERTKRFAAAAARSETTSPACAILDVLSNSCAPPTTRQITELAGAA